MTQDALDSFKAIVSAAAEALVAEARAANARFETSVDAALRDFGVDQLKPAEQEAYNAIVLERTMAASREMEIGV